MVPPMDDTANRQTGETAEARRLLATIPGFSAGAAKSARIERLPGLTNRVYAVTLDEGRFVLRIPGDGTSAIIDRRAEETNARAAAEAGIAPEVLYFGADGLMLTRFIEGAEPLSPERLRGEPETLKRVGVALRRLHEDVPAFASRLGPFATIDAYKRVLVERGIRLTMRQQAVLAGADRLRDEIDASADTFASCHCDPTGRNLLDTGERVWLVDWEYSGMNDPWWDLSYCSFQAGLPDDADATLLAAYLDRAPTAREAARMAVMKVPVELMSALWALIQDLQGNQAADFRAYAERVFEESAARMRAPEFAAAVAALGKP